MIKFLGKRKSPGSIDHTPHLHPQDPHEKLPTSFQQYRKSAQQHGPLGNKNAAAKNGAHSGATNGGKPIGNGELYLDRSMLPERFHRSIPSAEEIEAVESAFYMA